MRSLHNVVEEIESVKRSLERAEDEHDSFRFNALLERLGQLVNERETLECMTFTTYGLR